MQTSLLPFLFPSSLLSPLYSIHQRRHIECFVPFAGLGIVVVLHPGGEVCVRSEDLACGAVVAAQRDALSAIAEVALGYHQRPADGIVVGTEIGVHV